ncbi:insulinase family protein [Raoultibacter phocaeensis]|uniref:insulinase family protein n=1 Tax=Raoultibacter phocaeensis TaxID=2479841 RepID=UPI0015D5DC65|nr:insulinase family protein [Raoultibacter phocaeensis]
MAPENDLATGTSLQGFTVESAEELEEIDGKAFVLLHEKSGAKLLYLQNDDENKAFSIAFKTPPADSTGVFHILEHSVLCGSRKFPVKEPFVNLIKSSMQTFLNAMTFSDKTMYPVASTNEQDLLNLMDVYLDAVLHPAIYEKRAIFEQEGWHYELDETSEALKYNGVVYNEMKGALSDPDSVLYNALSAALFPDTAYAFESGGDPAVIPELTYEAFLDEHARHYRLDNSYIVLYGDMDVRRVLAFLDENYLSEEQKPVGNPNPLTLQAPVSNLDVVKKMETAPENAAMGLGYVVGTSADRLRVIATDILADVLLGSNEAPLKKALLKANIADDIDGYLIDAQLQPAFYILTKGVKPGTAELFRETVENTCRNLVEGGFDRERIEASLARAEFMLRERDFGTADGVVLAMSAMSGWLYDDSMATDYLRFEDAFAELRRRMEQGYFEDLLREIVLRNDHRALAVLEPVESLDETCEEARLAAIRADMSDDDLEAVKNEVAELRRLQEKPDSPAALATLPLLTLDDIADPPVEPAWELIESTPYPCLYHEAPTRGIDYVYTYFDMGRLAFEDLPYATLAAMLLGKLDTREHTAEELDKLTQTHLGSLRFFVDVYTSEKDGSIAPKFVIATSSLSENIEHAVALSREIRCETRFNDKDKIRDVLTQTRIRMEQAFATAGNSAALLRCASYVSKSALVRERLSNVDFYRFLKGVLAHFDTDFEATVERIEDVAARLFAADGTIVSFTGAPEDRDRFWELAGTMDLPEANAPRVLAVPEPKVGNEAFVVPADVCFAAKGYDAKLLGIGFEGSWQVAAKAISYDYLWNEVRVKGGAYGAGFRALRSGTMQFYSYRDPNLDETIARFDGAAAWLSAFDPDEAEMRGYIISSIAGMDAPAKPRDIARRQDGDFFCERPLGYREKTREQLLETTPESLRAKGGELARVSAEDVRCAFGNRSIIESSVAEYAIVDLLG